MSLMCDFTVTGMAATLLHGTTSWPSGRIKDPPPPSPLPHRLLPTKSQSLWAGREGAAQAEQGRGHFLNSRELASEGNHLRLPRLPRSCRSSPSERIRREGVR